MAEKKKVLIDCDPGIDDSFALLLCFKHLDVVGVTAVGGNTALKYTQRNARYLAQITGHMDTPVHAGYPEPMMTTLTRAEDVHGSQGLGSVQIEEPVKQLNEGHAVDFIIDTFMNHDDVSLITLGPLTNVAQALLKEPKLKERIPEILVMGGSVTSGNFNGCAEFNIYVDPEAAKLVFESGIPIKMVGLNLTRQNLMSYDELERIKKLDTEVGKFASKILEFSLGAGYACNLCDACTVVWYIDPSIIKKSIKMHVDVETKGEFTRGMTVCDYRSYISNRPEIDIEREKVQRDHPGIHENVEAAMELDREKFIKLLLETIESY